jgi:hypothetical protein
MAKCRCDCGQEVRKIWAKGHCNRRPPKPCVPCGCGCGKPAAPGCKYLRDHSSKDPEKKQVRREMFDRLWKEGKFRGRRVWNEGFTKETSEKLVEVGKKISASFTPEKREKYRDRSTRINAQFLVHGKGPNHPNWKGGVATIYQRLYGGSELFHTWKRPILMRDEFTCRRCRKDGTQVRLHVHHDIERMSSVVHRVVLGLFPGAHERELSFDEVGLVVAAVIERHVQEKISGLTLCEECHRKEHREEPT